MNREMAAKHVPVDNRTKKTVVMSRPHSMLVLRDVEGERKHAGGVVSCKEPYVCRCVSVCCVCCVCVCMCVCVCVPATGVLASPLLVLPGHSVQ